MNPIDASGVRDLPSRRKLPHEIPSWVKSGSVFFITVCCTPRGQNQLCVDTVAKQLLEAVEFRQARGNWHMHLILLMPDHLHMLGSFPRDEDMRRSVANFKEITAKKAGLRWQRDFFDHRLRNDESLDEKTSYIRMNPVRKGLVLRAEDWPYVWPSNCAAGPAVPPYL